MVKIMANENDELWGLNPKVDDETVKTAREFLREHPEIAKKYTKYPARIKHVCPTGHESKIGSKIISNFLGQNWYLKRVVRSLERLKLAVKEIKPA